jgi:hypothetical protein
VSADTLERCEAIIDASGVAPLIESKLAVGVRPRQLSVRTLLVGLLLVLGDDRPAHLVRVHRALVALEERDMVRLGVLVHWHDVAHLLTYRQIEYTFGVLTRALAKDHPDGDPSDVLALVLDALVEASVPAIYKDASSSLAVDWSDQEAFATPPARPERQSADQEASWGHRRPGPGKSDLFFGYYFSAATMVNDESGPPVPELVRRMALSTCAHDPVRAVVPVLERMAESDIALGDLLCDSGYAHRRSEYWALPLRAAGARLVMDLHPSDRGTKGTFGGAICCNGNLYCPCTPPALLTLGPLPRGATEGEVAAHDVRSAELARYKLGRISRDDADGYHRVMCPAAMGKVRCPRREQSMNLPFDRPSVAGPPESAPTCCVQATLSVPAEVNAKTTQKHDYPSAAHRRSFARRTAVERSYSTLKDPASTDVTRGWCRVMGLSAISLLLACAVVTRNVRITDAFEDRQRDDQRRRDAGLEPKTRKRRRRTSADLIAAATG